MFQRKDVRLKKTYKLMKNYFSLFVITTAALLFSACEKPQMGSITVKFNDSGAPVTYDKIMIDIRRVEVKFANTNTNGEFGKYFLDAFAGQHNLANLSDSIEANIANKKRMPIGALTEMRIVVGDENYIKINGVTYDLIITNAPNSGLTFPLDDKGVYDGQQAEITLNIDVAGSVIQSGGIYMLNPLIVVE